MGWEKKKEGERKEVSRVIIDAAAEKARKRR